MNVLVIIPTYNERDNLPVLVRQILDRYAYRVLVVDDDSPDGTGAVADALAAEFPGRLEVVHRTGKRGLGLSYVDGFKRALATDAQFICQMDADLSHDPQYLPDLVNAAATRYDVVLGSRYLNGVSVVNWPLRRIMLSSFANAYVRTVTGLQNRDWRASNWIGFCPIVTRSSWKPSSRRLGSAAVSAKSRSCSSNDARVPRRCRGGCSSSRCSCPGGSLFGTADGCGFHRGDGMNHGRHRAFWTATIDPWPPREPRVSVGR
jgi:hypothetical protein